MIIPYYVIMGSVAPGNRVKNFYGTDEKSAAYLLENIPRFRRGSFDIAIPGPTKPGPEDSLELKWGDRKILRLYKDGTLVFRVRADSEFLGWGVEPHEFVNNPRLDPIVVVEVNTSFVHQYGIIIQHLEFLPEKAFIHLSLHDFIQEGMHLFITEIPSIGMIDWDFVDKYDVRTLDNQIEFPVQDLIDNPNQVAYEVVCAFFSMFGMPPDKIPFVKRTGEQPEVDLAAIQNI